MSELDYSQQKNFGPEELFMFHTANTTVETCAEWVAAVATPHTTSYTSYSNTVTTA